MSAQEFRRAVSIGAVTCMLLAIIGCSRAEPDRPVQPAASPGWPPSLDAFSFAWTAEPGIDLVSDGAVVAARAYTESYYLAQITGDDKYLYPGFADSVDENQTQIGAPEGTSSLWPETTSSSVWIGTARHHVLGVSRSGDDVAVTACALLFGAAIERENGKYNAVVGDYASPAPGVYPMRIGLHAPEQIDSNTAPQQGPARAASNDAFDGWRVTSHQSDYLTSERWDDFDRDQARCMQIAAKEPGVDRGDPTKPYLASDFPMAPAVPGWPHNADG